MITSHLKLNGDKQLVKNLHKVTDKVARKHLAHALRKGAQVQVKAMKQFAPVAKAGQTHFGLPVKRGLLRKSIGIRTKKKGRVAYAIVGPRRRKFKTLIGQTKDGKPVYMNPTQYAHLINNGHVIKRGTKVIGRFEGTHFMERAYGSAVPKTMAEISNSFAKKIRESV